MKSTLRLFQSIKFNVWLFTFLALGAVLGTFVPQLTEVPEQVDLFTQNHPLAAGWFGRLSLFNIYHSWWFIGLLGLLAFDVIVCKLIFGKFPGFSVFKSGEKSSNFALGQAHQESFSSGLSATELEERVQRLLRKQKYALSGIEYKENGGVVLFAAKHRLQRYGSWVSHIAILLVLTANLTGALYGFREVVNVPEQSANRLKNRPWVVRCDDFAVEWYPASMTPKSFASNLRLFDQGQAAMEAKVMVNHPLEYKRVRIYQATYGPHLKEARVGFFNRINPERSPVVTLRLNQESPVPGTEYSLRILEFVPDFSMKENMEVTSRSPLPENPALQILVSKNGQPLKAPWIFEKYPAMQMPPPQKEDEFILILAEYVPAFYTGLQVTYDPGADLFWLACGILVLGLMTLFYLHHRKLWIYLEPNVQGTRVQVSGYSSRGASFAAEFAGMVLRLQG